MAVPLQFEEMAMTLKRAMDDVTTFREEVKQRPDLAPGVKRASDQELLAVFGRMAQMYPPQPYIGPDGQQVMVSEWIAALAYCEGGPEDIKRIGEIVKGVTGNG